MPKCPSVVAFMAAVIGVVGVATTSGCSTISFFPAAPAQKAADKVIDDIWPAPEVVKAPASTVASSDAVSGTKPAGAPAK